MQFNTLKRVLVSQSPWSHRVGSHASGDSSSQVAEQPSPSSVLPSSHCSPRSSTPLPQTGDPPCTRWHWASHRSSGLPLEVPSSHCSPGSTTPLPQVLVQPAMLPDGELNAPSAEPAAQPSNAPMSQRGPWGRLTLRWSVASQVGSPLPGVAGLPASKAALPGSRACVKVGPPLSWRGPRFAPLSRRSPLVSPAKVQLIVFTIRLKPRDVRFPWQSGPALSARMVFMKTTTPWLSTPVSVFVATVALFSVVVPVLDSPPPTLSAVWPLMGALRSATEPEIALPARGPCATFPLTVLRTTWSTPTSLSMQPPA